MMKAWTKPELLELQVAFTESSPINVSAGSGWAVVEVDKPVALG